MELEEEDTYTGQIINRTKRTVKVEIKGIEPEALPDCILRILAKRLIPTTMRERGTKSLPMLAMDVMSQTLKIPPSSGGLLNALWRKGVNPMMASV